LVIAGWNIKRKPDAGSNSISVKFFVFVSGT
jgi:hypothetical protein